MARPDVRRSAMPEPQKPLWQRLGWFAALWLASVAFLGVIAYGIRFWLGL
jgi:hypothetical protein